MPFFIEQVAGRKRQVVLDGRGLPHPDGVRWGGEQRMEVTWLPGSPDAIAQLFGPKQRDMTLSGRWNDSGMVGEVPDCIVKVDGRIIPSAVEAADLFDQMREEGSLIRVAYESQVRYGILVSFEWGPWAPGRTNERIEWQARFEWLSRGANPSAPALPTRIGTSTLANRVALILQKVDAAYESMTGAADVVQQALSLPVAKLRGISQTANQVAYAWVQRAASAADAAQATIGLTGELAASSYDLASASRSTCASQAAAIQRAAEQTARVGGLQVDAGLGSTIVVARDQRAMAKEARDLAALSDSVNADTQAALTESEPQIAYAQRGEDLRSIARRMTGSADNWRDIAALNGLSGSEVSPGDAILIPSTTRALATR